MADISMAQNVSINTLMLSLSQQFPNMKVTVHNLGAARVDGQGVIQFLQKPSEMSFELGAFERERLMETNRKEGCRRQIASARRVRQRGRRRCLST